MRISRIAGNFFLAIYLPIVVLAFLYTVLRQPIFFHPRPVVDFVYGMIAPYQAPIGQHGQIFAECFTKDDVWEHIDLAPFYPQMFGERNARELFSMYPHSKSDYIERRSMYAHALRETLEEQGTTCAHLRLSWDKWPAMTGGFYASYLPAFTTRTLLYED